MADQGIDLAEVMGAPAATDKKKSSGGGFSMADVMAPAALKKPDQQPSGPLGSFLDRSKTAITKAVSEFQNNPEDTTIAGAKALWDGASSMISLSMSGVGALAKTMFTPVQVPKGATAAEAAKINFDSGIANFSANQQKIQTALDGVNNAQPSKQDEAMQNLLGIIPDGIKALGDDVYERTGSALAASGAQTLATLLTLSPEVASKVMRKVTEYGSRGSAPSTVSSAFDELTVTQPTAAEALTTHLEQVDAKTAKAMRKRYDEILAAAPGEETEIIGKRAAEAIVQELGGLNTGEGHGTKRGTSGKPGAPEQVPETDPTLNTGEDKASRSKPTKSGPAEPLVTGEDPAGLRTGEGQSSRTRAARPAAKLTGDQVASTVRTAAKEGTEAMAANPLEDLDKMEDSAKPAGKPLYISSGIPITRAMVENFFSGAADLARKVPGVELAEKKMSALYQGFIETFNPEAKGPAAKTAGAAIARNFFEEAKRSYTVWTQGIGRRTYWNKMGDAASMDFIKNFEKGKKFANGEWERARQHYKNWADKIYAQDLKTGFTYDAIDHYMPHLFEDGDGIARFMQKRFGNKWADPRFIKERGYDLYQEAIDGGFTPRFTNPEDIMQARQHASDIAQLRTGLLADLEKQGVARKAEKGATKAPDGFWAETVRSPTGQRYWLKDEARPLWKNAFNSESLWNLQGTALKRGVSNTFRGWMGVKNALVPIKLGLSLFHPLHVMHIDMAAELTRSSKLLLGKPSVESVGGFMKSVATGYITPFTRSGSNLLKAFQGKIDPTKLSNADKASLHDLSEGGMVPTRPMEETSGHIQKFKDALAKRSVGAVFHLPFAAIASLAHPIFGIWIPELKIASYLKDAKVARELNPHWTDAQRQEAFRQVARKVEARYGEMNYNSLFMDKMVKDIGVASTLSLGWQLGLVDQYVGGAIDLGKSAKSIGLDVLDPESKGSALKKELAAGTLDRPVFAAYYIASAFMIGGLMHYMFTGKKPDKLIDYSNPESGEKDEYGKPIRLNTMFNTRDFVGLYMHTEQQGMVTGVSDFVRNKGSGLMEMATAAVTGVNSLGDQIRNDNDPAYKQVEQTLQATLTDLKPISLEAIQRSTGHDVKASTLSVLGFTPAGHYLSQTIMEGQIAEAYRKFEKPSQKPYEAVQMAKDVKELKQLYLKDDPTYDAKMDAAAVRYDFDEKDIGKMQRRFASPKEEEFDPSIFQFSKLRDWSVQKGLLDRMTPEERERYLLALPKSRRRKYENAHEGDGA